MKYKDVEAKIEKILENTLFCTFCTANKKGEICADQMCLVNNGLKAYIQTDLTFEKIKNIKENTNVAINCGAYTFKGIAKLLGKPTDNQMFVEKLKAKHLKTYEHYTKLPNEVLIEIELIECKIWGVDNKKDIHDQETITVVNLKDKTLKTIFCDKM